MEAEAQGRRQTHGRTPPEFMARPMVMLCILRIYSGKSYRWMEGYLEVNTPFRHEVGLGGEWPAYETVRRAMFYLDEP